jgi:hypothetical protein
MHGEMVKKSKKDIFHSKEKVQSAPFPFHSYLPDDEP